jgi:hypothetical protein
MKEVPMTAAEWNIVKEKLQHLADPVRLKCDDFEISLVLMRVTQFRNAIFVYVNGPIKGKWLLEECDESRRFYRKVSRSVLSTKEKQKFKELPKRLQKQLKIDEKYSFYREYWTSFNSLKRQFIKQNKSIELLTEG